MNRLSFKKFVSEEVTGSVKAGVKASYNPIGGTKDGLVGATKRTIKTGKHDLGMEKPKVDTSAQDELLAQQREQQAALDDEENRRRKKLLSVAQGTRAYRGSAMFRAAPSNTAGVAAAAPAVAGRGGYAGGIAAGGASGGGSRASTPGRRVNTY